MFYGDKFEAKSGNRYLGEHFRADYVCVSMCLCVGRVGVEGGASWPVSVVKLM